MEDIIPASAVYVGSVGHYAVCVRMLYIIYLSPVNVQEGD